LYGAARIGDFEVTRDDRQTYRRQTYRRWALVLLGASALALSGCGRKGPLELPPTASSQPGLTANAVQPDPGATAEASKPNMFNSNYGSDQLPVAGKGPKRPFALDPLLDSK
jgi:predicted small lipoprotein YifL